MTNVETYGWRSTGNPVRSGDSMSSVAHTLMPLVPRGVIEARDGGVWLDDAAATAAGIALSSFVRDASALASERDDAYDRADVIATREDEAEVRAAHAEGRLVRIRAALKDVLNG